MANKRKKKNRKKQLAARIVIFVFLLLCLIGIFFLIWKLNGKKERDRREGNSHSDSRSGGDKGTDSGSDKRAVPYAGGIRIDTTEMYSSNAVLYRLEDMELLLNVKGDERIYTRLYDQDDDSAGTH